jgi:caffeoyl-CoA O-methyltransferase
MEFLPEAIQHYAEEYSEAEPPLLQELYRATWQRVLYPRMVSGHMQGRILSLFSKLVRPARILEVGTYTGYSAISLSEGLQAGGSIDTIEVDPEIAAFAAEWFEKAQLGGTIRQHIGPALEILPTLTDPYDLVFLDADKENYLNYYQAVLPQLPAGALILTDNVLWSGKVVEKSKQDETTEALKVFNNFVKTDTRVEALLLPVRDGIYCIRKK